MYPTRHVPDRDTGLVTFPTGIAAMWLNTTPDVIDDLVYSGRLVELTPGRIQVDSIAAFVADENPDLASKLRVAARTLLDSMQRGEL
jgi:hypothetical protein